MRLTAVEPGAVDDEVAGAATIRAGFEAGIRVFDTARAYGRDDGDLGRNERLLAGALRGLAGAHIVTKGGMRRPAGAWVPDGRAGTLRADCEASLAALDGLPIDLFLLHAPDPRTPLDTSVRALAGLVDAGLVRHVGLSGVNRTQLEQALSLAPIAAVEVGLGPFDDLALRGGLIELCAARGVALLAHTPLGGRQRARRLARDPVLAELAAARSVTAAQMALAWLLDLHPVLLPIPGATRPETARAAAAAGFALSADERARLALRFPSARLVAPRRAPAAPVDGGEVVLLMGIPGAGKSTAVAALVDRGYQRLNRDERGGTLRQLCRALDLQLADGVRRVVLDNTYLTRAVRRDLLDIADRHQLPVRCLWIDTPIAEAQVNLVRRMLERHGSLIAGDELRRSSDPALLAPGVLYRALRQLEPPGLDEGFAAVERLPFARRPVPGHDAAVILIAAEAVTGADSPLLRHGGPGTPRLLFDWRPGDSGEALRARAADLAASTGLPIEAALCPHPAGPPICWCRPPFPGLPLAFAAAHRADLTRSLVIGATPTHRTLATTIGAHFIEAGSS